MKSALDAESVDGHYFYSIPHPFSDISDMWEDQSTGSFVSEYGCVFERPEI